MNRNDLMLREGVTMVGKGKKIVGGMDTGRAAIVIGVVKKKPMYQLKASQVIPKRVEGIETDVVETGVIRQLTDMPKAEEDKKRTDKWRPVPGGVSCGHPDVTSGTVGTAAYKKGVLYFLTCNHVAANGNKASIGDPFLQPGSYYGGSLVDMVGTLEDFVKINKIGVPSDCPVTRAVCSIFNWLAYQILQPVYILVATVNSAWPDGQ
jgi:hypothetical protein